MLTLSTMPQMHNPRQQQYQDQQQQCTMGTGQKAPQLQNCNQAETPPQRMQLSQRGEAGDGQGKTLLLQLRVLGPNVDPGGLATPSCLRDLLTAIARQERRSCCQTLFRPSSQVKARSRARCLARRARQNVPPWMGGQPMRRAGHLQETPHAGAMLLFQAQRLLGKVSGDLPYVKLSRDLDVSIQIAGSQ